RFLKRRALRQLGDIVAAIIESTVPDRRYRRCDDRLAPRDRACGDRGRTLASFAPPREAADVGSPVLTAARIVRIGAHADAAAADIRVQRLCADFQELERLFAREPDFHG